jgi:toxin YhaV
LSRAMERNGWRLFAHPAFLEQFEALVGEVDRLTRGSREQPEVHPKAKLLKRILELILDEIPRDPNASVYQLGNTLGQEGRHWRRAKFLQRFRLFFRFSSVERVIVYGWVNDETSLRQRGARSDVYSVFRKRLDRGDPPDDWIELLRMSRDFEIGDE